MKAYFRRFWGLRSWKRHSLILMIAGIIYVFIGVSFILSEYSTTRAVALAVVLSIAPLEFWGGVFIFAGGLSIISSRWPPFTEIWGYMVLTGLSVGWGSAYLMGIIFGNSPWTNASGFLTWGLIGFLWWAISGLLNPNETAVTSHAESA